MSQVTEISTRNESPDLLLGEKSQNMPIPTDNILYSSLITEELSTREGQSGSSLREPIKTSKKNN